MLDSKFSRVLSEMIRGLSKTMAKFMNLARLYSTLGLCTICVVLLFLVPTKGHAQTVTVGDIKIDPKDFSPQNDRQTRISTCLQCHGQHAGGDIDFGPDVQFGTPALRGMQQDYLKQSLIAYKTGKRVNQEMRTIASMLDEETIDFMARTFAAYPTPQLKNTEELATLTKTDEKFRKGQAIAKEGASEKGVPACMACHGQMGEGNTDLGPRLAGQNSLYIQRQFKEFAERTRRTDQAEIMQPVAASLSEDEIELVAYYYQELVRIAEQD